MGAHLNIGVLAGLGDSGCICCGWLRCWGCRLCIASCSRHLRACRTRQSTHSGWLSRRPTRPDSAGNCKHHVPACVARMVWSLPSSQYALRVPHNREATPRAMRERDCQRPIGSARGEPRLAWSMGAYMRKACQRPRLDARGQSRSDTPRLCAAHPCDEAHPALTHHALVPNPVAQRATSPETRG